ncbi:MAG: hypothetical protein WKF58_00705 [Ilumatobacteraceae bacterium]
MLPDAFNFTAPDGTLEMDEELLDSAEITNEDPQVVQFVINAEAAWSDGEPIDCDDWQLAWLASSGKWIQQDDAGAPVTDPDTGLELPVFDTAGTTGLRPDRVDGVLGGRQDDRRHVGLALR